MRWMADVKQCCAPIPFTMWPPVYAPPALHWSPSSACDLWLAIPPPFTHTPFISLFLPQNCQSHNNLQNPLSAPLDRAAFAVVMREFVGTKLL